MKTIEATSFTHEKELYHKVRDAFDQHGVVLLRGLQLDQNKFESFTQMFCTDFYRISSRESLRKSSGDGFTTVTFQENFFLFIHSDGDYAPYPLTPDIGFLMSIEAPHVPGGETIVVDGIEMLNTLTEELRERFKSEKITYEFLWEPERWQAQFNVSSKKELLALLNYLENIKFNLNDGMLHIFYTTSALTLLPNNTASFSNAILGHLPHINHPDYIDKPILTREKNQVYWQDGEPLSEHIVNQLITLQDELKLKHRWETNDILIFDNLRFMHGREMTDGECNRILLSRFGYLK